MPGYIKSAALAAMLAGVSLTVPAVAQETGEEEKVFYLLSHGGESDPFWIDWNAGAMAACEQLGVTCNISFSNGDFAVQKEAFNAAIAAQPDGIATTSAQPGLWEEEVPRAKSQDIPVVFFNTDDPSIDRLAYVGADLVQAGVIWAEYLVENGLVESGDTVFMPVEVPGASYQTLETQGVASVFDPLGIEYEVVGVGIDPAGIIAKMSSYLIANEVDAIIALGDSVAASIQRVFDNVGLQPGSIPVIGWGNSEEAATAVEAGYIDAAAWQYPAHQGFMPVALLDLASDGVPIGYDILTLQLYDADSVDQILEVYAE